MITVTFEAGNTNVRIVRIVTDSTLVQVTTAGWYSNTAPNQLQPSDEVEIAYAQGTGSAATAFFSVSISSGVVTLSVAESGVVLPVVSGHFAVFSGTSGAIADLGYLPSDATKTRVSMVGGAVAINRLAKFTDITGTVDDATSAGTNLGDLYAGADAVAGAFRSYPATTATGFLGLTGISNSGAFNTIISNAAMGQTSTISIPNPGAATANFIISALTGAGVQHITTGSLQIDAGGLLAGLTTGGTAGILTLYPTTASNGALILSPVAAGGAFNTTISNGTMGQSTVMTIPDVGAATGQFLVKTAALISGNVVVASGTAGKVVDGGFAVKANTTAAYGGGGTSNAFTATGLATTSIVTAVILTSTNAVSIAKAVPTANTLTVTFSADPGAATTVSWIAITPAV